MKTHIKITTKDSFQAKEAVYEMDTDKEVRVVYFPYSVHVYTYQPDHKVKEVNILLTRAEVISVELSNKEPKA